MSTAPKPVKARTPSAAKAAPTGGKAKNAKKPAPDSNELQIESDPNKTKERQIADLIVGGVAGNAIVMLDYAKGAFGVRGLTETTLALKASTEAMCGGDLKGAESMLVTQAAALNSIFGELARRAALNMGEFPDAFERYMRLSLKAQGQCRATLETLAAIKNPPVVFARQANINNGGQQQVNNGAQANSTGAATCSPAQETQPGQNKLLEATHGERLDFGAQGQAGRANQGLEAVGEVNRPANTRG